MRRSLAAFPDKDAATPVTAKLTLFQQAFNAAEVGLTHCSRDLRYLLVNPAYAELAGLPVDQIVGRPIVEVMGESAFEVIRPHVERVLAGEPAGYEGRVPWAARGMRWIGVAYAPKKEPDGSVSGWFATVTDVTERKDAEAALTRAAAELGALVSATAQIVWKAEPDGVAKEDSPSWRAFTGQSYQEWVGEGWLDAVHPEDREQARTAWLAALSKRAVHESQYRIRHVSGEWRWTVARATPVFDANGDLYAYIGMNSDITERVRAEEALLRLNSELEARIAEAVREREQAQAKLARSQKMEALGNLAGGIAHDFNNVLQVIQIAVELIERRSDDSNEVRRLAQMVGQASKRGSNITHRLLSFGRRADLQAEPIDAVELMADMQELLSHTLGPGIAVHTQAAPSLPPFLADRNQLETVLVNLATNARDAMSGAGKLSLSAALEAATRSVGSGEFVRLSVFDDGPGMSAEVLARASEPFFTTKEHGKGSGLGLAMARGFAEQSGGAFEIESPPGKGLIVNLWFPLAQGLAAEPPPSAERKVWSASAGRIRVMIVDDERLVREVVGEQLADAGFDVVSAASGPEALALLDRGDTPDALVCDLAMPGLDGLSVIREARRVRPGLPAILLTGHVTEAAKLAGTEAFALMRKPTDGRALAEKIMAMIEEKRRSSPDERNGGSSSSEQVTSAIA